MKQIFSIVFFIIGICGFSQNVNKEIEKDFNEYSKLISEKNIDKALDYTNPKFFEIISRQQLKDLFIESLRIPNFDIKAGLPIFLKFENQKKIDEVTYVKFYIISPIEIKFIDVKLDKEQISQKIQGFESKYGVGKVVYDEKTGIFKIKAEKIIIASCTDSKLLDWKFVTVDNPKMKVLLEKIIPAELLN